MNTKFLIVFDIDHTLINWFKGFELDHDGYFVPVEECEERFNAHEMLTNLSSYSNVDIAFFTTGSHIHAMNTHYEFFDDIQCRFLLGIESVQYFEDKKVKNIEIFSKAKHGLIPSDNKSYNIDNILLVDDKPRNAMMYPEHYIPVKDLSWYEKNDEFDNELVKIEKKLKRIIDKALNNGTTLIDAKNFGAK